MCHYITKHVGPSEKGIRIEISSLHGSETPRCHFQGKIGIRAALATG